jgi:hypothetical protein
MSLLCFALWLDLRGQPCGRDLDTLFGLYSGVREKLQKANLQPPAGSAVAGVLHLAADLEDDYGDDGGLSLLAMQEDGSVWLDGHKAGASTHQSTHLDTLVASPDNLYCALLGKTNGVTLRMLDTALSAARGRIERGGAAPYLLVELDDDAGFAVLADAESAHCQLPVAALLKPNEELWTAAISAPGSGTTAAAPEMMPPRGGADEGSGGVIERKESRRGRELTGV